MSQHVFGASRTAPLRAAGVGFKSARTQRFFGIIVRMFAEAGGQHHVAHFHAYWQDEVAIISIEPIDVIAGSLPTRQRRLVEA